MATLQSKAKRRIPAIVFCPTSHLQREPSHVGMSLPQPARSYRLGVHLRLASSSVLGRRARVSCTLSTSSGALWPVDAVPALPSLRRQLQAPSASRAGAAQPPTMQDPEVRDAQVSRK